MCAARSGSPTASPCCGRPRSAPWGRRKRPWRRKTPRCSNSWSATSRWPSFKPKGTMDLAYKQEVGVGALVLTGLALFALGLFWFSGRSIGSHGVYVDAVFTNIQGLKEGDPVLVSGVKKGRVAKVRLDRVGKVNVTLQLSPHVGPKIHARAPNSALEFFRAQ